MTAPFRNQLLRRLFTCTGSSLLKYQNSMLPSLLLPGQAGVHALPSIVDVSAASSAFSKLQLRSKSGWTRGQRSFGASKAAYDDGGFGRDEAASSRSAGGGFADRYSVSGSGRKGSGAGRASNGGRGGSWRDASRGTDRSRGEDESGRYSRGGGRGGGRSSASGGRYRDSGSARYERDTDSRGSGSGDWASSSRYRDSGPKQYGRDTGSRGSGGGDWASSSRYRDSESSRDSYNRDDRRGSSRGAGGYQDERSSSSYQSGRDSRGRGVRAGKGTETAYSRADEYGRHGGGTWDRADAEPGPLAALKASWQGDALYGVAPVLAALASGRRTAHALYVQEGKEGRDQQAVQHAMAAAQAAAVPVEAASKHALNMLCDSRPHQGLVLDCSPLEWEALERLPPADSFPPGVPPVWLALDEVQDPMNFGAVLRCAHFLGASGIVACNRNAAPLSPVVSKASAGALEVMTIFSANNLPKTLAAANEDGWLILGAAAEGSAVDVLDFQLDRPTILVIGSEGTGLRTNVKRACSQLIRIGGGSTGISVGEDALERWAVDSLNVSVASGILLHQLIASARGSGTQPAAVSSSNGAVAAADALAAAPSDD